MENRGFEWVGNECGHHATYTFYKAVKYRSRGAGNKKTEREGQNNVETKAGVEANKWKVLSLGQFFFVKIWTGSDLLSVAELQLLWEDKTTGQMMSSVRLYFLPEYTADGRQPHHGDDELIAVAEKSVLRVPDLIDWLVPPTSVSWDRGTKSVSFAECSLLPDQKSSEPPSDQKLGPGPGLDLSEVDKISSELGDQPELDEPGVLVVSSPQYCRFRSVLKRLEGTKTKWLRNSLILALGGFATKTRNTFVMFAKEIFDYPELEEHPLLCNHLAPKLKGRPRKRRKLKEGGGNPNSPEDGSEQESNSSEGSNANLLNNKIPQPPARTGSRKDLLAILSQKNTKEETDFLRKLIKFMESRNTPIERPPMLGFKQIDLHLFFQKVFDLGGYDGCVSKKAWKSVYDELGGNPQNTSAATCTRRHYEKFLLSYEKHTKNTEQNCELRKSSKLDETMESENTNHEKMSTNSTNGIRELMGCLEENEEGNDVSEQILEKVIQENKEEKLEEKQEEQPATLETKPKIGIKPLTLLTHSDSVNKEENLLDLTAGKLKMDDLIIIPNNPGLGNTTDVEEGGSALQNLAKIASRYSSMGKDKNRAQEFPSPGSKKPRLEAGQGDNKPGVAQPLPPSNNKKPIVSSMSQPNSISSHSLTQGEAALGKLSSNAATSLLQQFSLLSPGMFSGWPTAAGASGRSSPSATPTITSNPRQSTTGWPASSYNLDPAKIGQEGYNLLKYYEQQLKALQQGQIQQPKINGTSKEVSPAKKESGHMGKNKEKTKVSKPPPDTKRPPRLLATPCQYLQTASIYGSPRTELQKAKESVISKPNSDRRSTGGAPVPSANNNIDSFALDLSSTSSVEYHIPTGLTAVSLQSSNIPKPIDDQAVGVLNLARPDKLLSSKSISSGDAKSDTFTQGLGYKDQTIQPKASPFSAEALLSKPISQKTQEQMKNLPPLSMGIKGILEAEQNKRSPQASPALPRTSPALPRASPAPSHLSSRQSPSLEMRSKTPSSAPPSPWHLPPNIPHSSPYSKPAAPVTPNIRQTSQSSSNASSLNNQMLAFYNSSGAGPPPSLVPPSTSSITGGLTTETTFSSLSSLPTSSLQPPSNPYLSALMQQSTAASLHQTAKQSSMSNLPPGYPSLGNPMDPASQYYAALYQQQITAYQQAAAAALSSPYGAQQAAAAAAAAAGYRGPQGGLQASAAAEMQALQAYKDMMTRAALGGNSVANSTAQMSQGTAMSALASSQSNSAANPYAALYAGLMGYPPSGFPGAPRKEGP